MNKVGPFTQPSPFVLGAPHVDGATSYLFDLFFKDGRRACESPVLNTQPEFHLDALKETVGQEFILTCMATSDKDSGHQTNTAFKVGEKELTEIHEVDSVPRPAPELEPGSDKDKGEEDDGSGIPADPNPPAVPPVSDPVAAPTPTESSDPLPSTGKHGTIPAELNELRGQINAMQANIAALVNGVAPANMAVTQIRDQLAAMNNRINDLASRGGPDLTGLKDELTANFEDLLRRSQNAGQADLTELRNITSQRLNLLEEAVRNAIQEPKTKRDWWQTFFMALAAVLGLAVVGMIGVGGAGFLIDKLFSMNHRRNLEDQAHARVAAADADKAVRDELNKQSMEFLKTSGENLKRSQEMLGDLDHARQQSLMRQGPGLVIQNFFGPPIPVPVIVMSNAPAPGHTNAPPPPPPPQPPPAPITTNTHVYLGAPVNGPGPMVLVQTPAVSVQDYYTQLWKQMDVNRLDCVYQYPGQVVIINGHYFKRNGSFYEPF